MRSHRREPVESVFGYVLRQVPSSRVRTSGQDAVGVTSPLPGLQSSCWIAALAAGPFTSTQPTGPDRPQRSRHPPTTRRMPRRGRNRTHRRAAQAGAPAEPRPTATQQPATAIRQRPGPSRALLHSRAIRQRFVPRRSGGWSHHRAGQSRSARPASRTRRAAAFPDGAFRPRPDRSSRCRRDLRRPPAPANEWACRCGAL